jgi:hypothetical protein
MSNRRNGNRALVPNFKFEVRRLTESLQVDRYPRERDFRLVNTDRLFSRLQEYRGGFN